MAEERSVEERVEEMFTADMEPDPVDEFDNPPNKLLDDEEVEAQEGAEEEVEEEVDDGDPLVEFEWDGQIIEAPQTIVDALMRQDDYTRKTQEVSAQRKQAEVQLAELENLTKRFQFAESIQGDVLQVEQFDAQAKQYQQYLRENIDHLSSTDIERIRLGIEDTRRQKDELVQSIQGRQAEFQQAYEQSMMELINKGTEVLRQKIPGWGEQQQKQVRDYALANGFTEQEISQVVDPRQVEVLYKAAQYDALREGATPAVKKVQKAPTIKAKARNPMPNEVKDKLNLRKKLKSPKLSSRDKARLIQENLGSRWG